MGAPNTQPGPGSTCYTTRTIGQQSHPRTERACKSANNAEERRNSWACNRLATGETDSFDVIGEAKLAQRLLHCLECRAPFRIEGPHEDNLGRRSAAAHRPVSEEEVLGHDRACGARSVRLRKAILW